MLDTDRRTFLATALAAALARPSGAWAPAAADPDETFLNRLTFGATDEARDALARLGREAWLAEEIATPPDGPSMSARLSALRLRIAYEAGEDENGSWEACDELRPLGWLPAGADQAAAMRLDRWDVAMDWAERIRPADEVVLAALVRAVHEPAQVNEVMTQFWHDHFNVSAFKDASTAVYFPAYDRALRANALGNFRILLGEVARAPAMLAYLGNADSRASPANENFARELLELHTLGIGNYRGGRDWKAVPGAAEGRAEFYTDADVWEVARAFTGWTIGDGRWIAEGETAPETGRFAYVDAWHDPYQKRVLGRELLPMAGPEEDGEAVLDILATHPGTARFVSTKIARRLLADEPAPDLVERLAAVFLAAAEAPDQIAQVVTALATHPAFAAPPAKRRRPFEFLAAIYRAAGAEVAPEDTGYAWHLARAGWLQHALPPPNGHPDRAVDWSSGAVLLRQVDLALSALEEWFGVVRAPLALPPEVTTFGELAAHWTGRLHGPHGTDGLAEVLGGWGVAPGDVLPGDAGDRQGLSTTMVAFAALSPRFLFR
jgi:uncharacterized protein (DUF1800 family)